MNDRDSDTADTTNTGDADHDDAPRERAANTVKSTYRDHLLLAIGSLGALAWFAMFLFKGVGIVDISYEELALMGAGVAILLQLEPVTTIASNLWGINGHNRRRGRK